MENISKHITYKEATFSATAKRKGITNSPDHVQLDNMKMVANDCFEPARVHFDKAIFINSFFRCVTLNSVIGGSQTSQHCSMDGSAIDMDTRGTKGFTNAELFNWLRENVEFDQLLWEYGNDNEPDWVHISKRKSNNRGEVMRVMKIDGVTRYRKI
jgi:hypothetical protein